MDRKVATVFGGSGFIGRHVVQRLAADGWIVRVAVRDPEAAMYLKVAGEAGQIVPIAADITKPETVAKAVEDAEWVVNLVGILYERGKATFQRVHAEGAASVARASAAAGVRRLVQMSAIGADPQSEAAYARTKAAGEAAAQAAFPDVTVVRPSIVIGPEDDFFNRFAAMARFAPALPAFPTRFQPVYVGDVAEAIVRCLGDAATKGRTYELGGPRVYSFKELMELMLEEICRPRPVVELPLWVASAQACVLQFLPVPPITPDQVRLLKVDNVVGSGALTLADLGITPTGIEAIMPGYLDRFRPPSRQRKRMP